MSRFWTYTRESWMPEYRWRPYQGADEYGRRTLVLPIPFGGYLVVAYWTCHCFDCTEMREQTARWEAEINQSE